MEDSQVRADHAWARRLPVYAEARAIADEPLAGSLIASCASVRLLDTQSTDRSR
jgi:hypothetical protein